jgi:hypothetical protein
VKLTISGKGKNNLRGKRKFLKFNTWENICTCDYPIPFIKKKKKRKKKKKQKTKLKKKKKSSDSHTNVYRSRESVIIKKRNNIKRYMEKDR